MSQSFNDALAQDAGTFDLLTTTTRRSKDFASSAIKKTNCPSFLKRIKSQQLIECSNYNRKVI
jgi:hypothetical protein